MTTNVYELLGLRDYTVTVAGWPTPIAVAADRPESAVAKARMACVGTTRNMKWMQADASATLA